MGACNTKTSAADDNSGKGLIASPTFHRPLPQQQWSINSPQQQQQPQQQRRNRDSPLMDFNLNIESPSVDMNDGMIPQAALKSPVSSRSLATGFSPIPSDAVVIEPSSKEASTQTTPPTHDTLDKYVPDESPSNTIIIKEASTQTTPSTRDTLDKDVLLDESPTAVMSYPVLEETCDLDLAQHFPDSEIVTIMETGADGQTVEKRGRKINETLAGSRMSFERYLSDRVKSLVDDLNAREDRDKFYDAFVAVDGDACPFEVNANLKSEVKKLTVENEKLTSEVKQLKVEKDELKSKVETLEKRLTKLENIVEAQGKLIEEQKSRIEEQNSRIEEQNSRIVALEGLVDFYNDQEDDELDNLVEKASRLNR